MAITLVEVYQVLSDVIREAQESEAKAQILAQQVQALQAEVEHLQEMVRAAEAERDRYKEQDLVAFSYKTTCPDPKAHDELHIRND